jgi:hypothetical protein
MQTALQQLRCKEVITIAVQGCPGHCSAAAARDLWANVHGKPQERAAAARVNCALEAYKIIKK